MVFPFVRDREVGDQWEDSKDESDDRRNRRSHVENPSLNSNASNAP
jgi:hypothetical protein